MLDYTPEGSIVKTQWQRNSRRPRTRRWGCSRCSRGARMSSRNRWSAASGTSGRERRAKSMRSPRSSWPAGSPRRRRSAPATGLAPCTRSPPRDELPCDDGSPIQGRPRRWNSKRSSRCSSPSTAARSSCSPTSARSTSRKWHAWKPDCGSSSSTPNVAGRSRSASTSSRS